MNQIILFFLCGFFFAVGVFLRTKAKLEQTKRRAIQSISQIDLEQFKKEKPMSIRPLPWPEPKTARQILERLPSQKEICAQVQNKAPTAYVAYYESVFYLKNCVLHPIANLTVELMQQADDAGGIYELSTQEVLGLPQGAQWDSKQK